MCFIKPGKNFAPAYYENMLNDPADRDVYSQWNYPATEKQMLYNLSSSWNAKLEFIEHWFNRNGRKGWYWAKV